LLSGSKVLLVLLLLLLLLFDLLLTLLFLLGVERALLLFRRCLFLTRFDFRLVQSRLALLFLVTLRLVIAIARVLRTAGARIVELLLVVGLLLLVRGVVRGALRRFGIALRRRQFVLALLLGKRCLVRLLIRGALRRFSLVLRALDRRLLVAFARVLGALFVVERELLLRMSWRSRRISSRALLRQ